jgi:gas vesicle protein
MSKMRVAVKFFTLGLVLGLVFAPRAGRETRDQLRSQAGLWRGSEPGT